MTGQLPSIIDAVEARLADFYGFVPAVSAATHVVTREQLRTSLGDRVTELPEYQAQGGVFLLDPDHETNKAAATESELFIGIHFGETVQESLAGLDPLQRLDERNLNAFCILVEEVSHFHLLLNRAQRQMGVTKIELEWQGEVDKMLVCSLVLQQQQGHPHLQALARRLYDEARIVAPDHEVYWQATRYAARFWFSALRRGDRPNELRDLLRANYQVPWSEKVAQLDAYAIRKAS